jgi:hypothetical protein
MEIRIRHRCSETNVTRTEDVGPSGVQYDCEECNARSYRRDGAMIHRQIEDWITIDELKSLLQEKSL